MPSVAYLEPLFYLTVCCSKLSCQECSYHLLYPTHPHRQGTYTSTDGTIYTGGWKNNRQNGQGTMKYPGGHVYTGDWVNNIKHGTVGKVVG